MRNITKVAVGVLILFVYRLWFTSFGTLSSGDWPYLFLENIKRFPDFSSNFLWLTPYYQISAKILVEYLGLNWNFAEKLLWFWPFIILSIISSFYLTRSWIGVLIYTTNTYILMLVGGGQMGVALAYSIAPFVLARFMRLKDNLGNKIQKSLVAGFVLGIEIMFDPRVAYISMLAVILYFVFCIKYKVSEKSLTLLIPVGIAILLNSYWIIPFMKTGFSASFARYVSITGFQFLSFADFPHALSLLHPNWPENIFGKVYFMQSEFIVLPILAFISLLVFDKERKILFFACLGLLGAFLAKGSNMPFSEINDWLFKYFPGMNIFRDATKFYILIVLSYSVLIPFTVEKIARKFNSKFKNYLILAFIIFWLFLIRPAWLGQLEGTFKPNSVPKEYVLLKDFLLNKPQFFKTLWMPDVQRFGFSSKNHPASGGINYFNTSFLAEIIEKLKKPEAQKLLNSSSIKYIIVPDDSKMELFIVDRKYSEKQRAQAIEELKKIPWLKQLLPMGQIVIFEIKKNI